MGGEHLRAVIRLGLQAHGFSISGAAFAAGASRHWHVGTALRDEVFPDLLPAFADVQGYLDVAEADPVLWSRLPWMAATGFLQCAVLDRPAGSDDVRDPVALLAGTFTSAIVVLDFLVDERGMGDRVFGGLDPQLIASIFGAEETAQDGLARLYRAEHEPGVRLLLALVAMCGAQGRQLLAESGNMSAWQQLAEAVGQMYASQRALSGVRYPDRESALALMPQLVAKSTLPTVAVSCIAALTEGRVGVPAAWLNVGELLGQLYWAIDDLVDVLDDAHTGTPTSVLLRLEELASALERTWATDGDIYELVDDVSAEIVGLLRADKPGWEVPGALDLACLRVAAWSRWEESARAGTLADEPSPPSCDEETASRVRDATAVLLEHQRSGYADAVHTMTFPRMHDGVVRMETHPALLFQRAVILDCLLDARRVAEVSDDVIAAETLALLRGKHRGVAGGWSYIPEVAELPPDADDLGAVLLALCRVGGAVLAETCEDAIALALESAGADGSFPTWILDPLGQSKADEACRAYLWIGGLGIHPEVVANLLCALHEYDRERFATNLRLATRYFEATQGDDGLWQSRWYAGLFYGTYRVVDFLSRVDPSHQALRRAQHAIVDAQRADGGWGEVESDPLSTSFAVLSLAACGESALSPATVTALSRGVAALGATQEAGGGWPACLWGAFETGVGFESYGSQTITTAYCAKALLAGASTLSRVGEREKDMAGRLPGPP